MTLTEKFQRSPDNFKTWATAEINRRAAVMGLDFDPDKTHHIQLYSHELAYLDGYAELAHDPKAGVVRGRYVHVLEWEMIPVEIPMELRTARDEHAIHLYLTAHLPKMTMTIRKPELVLLLYPDGTVRGIEDED